MAKNAKRSPNDKNRLGKRVPLIFAIILVLALTARVLVGYQLASNSHDASAQTNSHLALAESIRSQDELAGLTGDRAALMPGYPVFLAGVSKLFGKKTVAAAQLQVAILQALISTLTIAVIYDIGRRMAGAWAGLVAAALLTINPMHILLCGRISPQTLFVFLFVLLIWAVLLFRETFRFSDAILAGAVFSAAVYISASAILFAPVLLVALALGRHRAACFNGWLLGAAILMLALAPWVVRNWRVLGRFAVTTTSVGREMYDAQRPAPAGRVELLKDIQDKDEVSRDRAYRNAAAREIVSNPGRFFTLAWGRIKALWNPAVGTVEAQGKIYEILGYVAFVPTALLAVLGLLATIRRRLWMVILMILPALYWTFIEAFRTGSAEHRLAAMPMIMVLSGAGLAWVFYREGTKPQEKKADG
ncbi:MAG: glycosyltransferase family 39 protein [Planctomycetia bacterium]|nr:glycosyltransferase family 39 protein [Planctomycetia bacterium]